MLRSSPQRVLCALCENVVACSVPQGIGLARHGGRRGQPFHGHPAHRLLAAARATHVPRTRGAAYLRGLRVRAPLPLCSPNHSSATRPVTLHSVALPCRSMVIQDPDSLVATIIQASRESNVRVLLQSSWSALTSDSLPSTIFALGPCPHDWLMPKMAAVIHHGGAGTVAAGLRQGKPSWVIPVSACAVGARALGGKPPGSDAADARWAPAALAGWPPLRWFLAPSRMCGVAVLRRPALLGHGRAQVWLRSRAVPHLGTDRRAAATRFRGAQVRRGRRESARNGRRLLPRSRL